MIAEPPPSAVRTWTIGLSVICIWILGGTYVWQHPVSATAEAVVQVPPGTDAETLCDSVDIVQAALETLAELDPPETTGRDSQLQSNRDSAKLTGTLTARKAINGTWKLTYQAPNADLAVNELSALVAALERHLTASDHEKAANERRRHEERLQELSVKRAGLRSDSHGDLPEGVEDLTQDELVESEVPTQSRASEDATGVKERINTLQRAMTEARVERLRTEEEMRLVEDALEAGKKLDAIAHQLTAGPIQDAVRQIDKQARLSVELKQIDATVNADAEVYGEKHPRLVELRRRFDRLLKEVGGWEGLLAESAVADQLMASLDQVLESRREREGDLRLQLELEQSEFQEQSQVVQAQSRTAESIKRVSAEIEDTRKLIAEFDQSKTTSFVSVQPPILSSQSAIWERGLSWVAVVIVGLLFGWIVSCVPRRERSTDFATSDEMPILTVPQLTFAMTVPTVSANGIVPNGNLDVTQSRATRQSRWQQTYT